MSIYWTILDSCRTALDALPAFDGIPITIRRRPWFDRDRDTLPMLCISPGADDLNDEQFQGRAFVDYPVLFSFWQANNATLANEAAMQALLDAREGVRKLHDTSLTGASTVFDSDYDPSPAFDLSGMDRLYDVSLQRIVFRSQEPRKPT